MRIVDRYISKSIISTFLITLFAFCLLYVLIDSAVNLDEFLDREVPINVLVQYYIANIPMIIIQTSSVALLISVLLTYAGLNGHNEVIALRSSGINFWGLAKPALCFSLVISAAVFLITENYLPNSQERITQIRNSHLILKSDRKRKKQKITNLTFYGLKNRLYYVESFDPNTHELEGITIIGYDENQNLKEKILAFSGKWTGIAWKFFDCHVTIFPQTPEAPTRVKVYQEKLVDIKETPEDFMKQRLNVDTMNIHQLRAYINRFANSGAKRAINNLRVDFHHKFSMPLRNLVIVLIGLPLVLISTGRRAQTFTALGIAILIGFLYYVTEAVGLALGKGGLFPPILSAWIAPGIFTSVALYVIWEKF